jgi:hypothetical protein
VPGFQPRRSKQLLAASFVADCSNLKRIDNILVRVNGMVAITAVTKSRLREGGREGEGRGPDQDKNFAETVGRFISRTRTIPDAAMDLRDDSNVPPSLPSHHPGLYELDVIMVGWQNQRGNMTVGLELACAWILPQQSEDMNLDILRLNRG